MCYPLNIFQPFDQILLTRFFIINFSLFLTLLSNIEFAQRFCELFLLSTTTKINEQQSYIEDP